MDYFGLLDRFSGAVARYWLEKGTFQRRLLPKGKCRENSGIVEYFKNKVFQRTATSINIAERVICAIQMFNSERKFSIRGRH